MASDSIFFELIRLEIELWNAVDTRLRTELDLPLTRYEPMGVIAARGECRILDVAADLAIGVSGTSKLVDRIETSGLCRRRANPEDRRSTIVTLTPLGRETLDQARAIVGAELEERIGEVLDAAERETLLDLLTRLRVAGQRRQRSMSSPSVT